VWKDGPGSDVAQEEEDHEEQVGAFAVVGRSACPCARAEGEQVLMLPGWCGDMCVRP
jgi:hypothetical protein